MTPKEKKLNPQRKRIDEIDKKLLDLLSERREIVHEVIDKKIQNQLPIFAPKREDEKTKKFREMAADHDLDPNWAEDFLRMIMASSRSSQSSKEFPRATEEPKHILVVGAKGGMGSLYSRIIKQTGHELYTIDKHNWHELEEMAPKLDLAIVTVPINVTVDVIERIAPKLKSDTILADFTSNKTEPIEAMKEAHDGPVLGLHPMHGPGVDNLSKQLMVFCPVRDQDASEWVVKQSKLWGMRVVEADAEKHDHVMHMVQGLRHFVALTHGSFMKTYDLKPQDILDYSSPIYRAELMMTGRIFAQSAELYADIVFANEERRELLLNFIEHNDKLARMVKNDDKEGFVKEFESVTDFFGKFASQALEESGYLINRLADRFA
ncbi:bifunctional chorismate mutase/prephenate dehydrogenase [Fodinibius halophilus]|uniref:chorismate mutase n=1 Tax=Fodinibius halophilus TaxID=1736908 RepID=A0A6M1T3S5_9BACT|nr:bifunctional chorismate mutase/prephenate dehydrogenase [Fodinibius halophilus]NGP87293.1 bifunctional chorismate mutase/prephenate dehydrogenase [Fodinibius halophilus]